MKSKKIFGVIAFYIGYGVICIVVLFPFFWMVTTSMRTDPQIFAAEVRLFSFPLTFVQYEKLFLMIPFFRFFLNSFLVATVTTALSLIIAIFAGFSLSRFRYPGRNYIAQGILFLYMVPGIAIIIPAYIFLVRMGLLNNMGGLIIMHTTFCVPFCTWTLFNFFDTIPIELENAAMIDGCSKMQAMLRITLPVSLPAIAVTVIFSFLLSWNEFMFASILIVDENLKTLPWGLSAMIGRFYVEWGPMMAGATLTVIPVLVLFVWIQKYMLAGLTAGAVKQ